jgi:hypothetical protein
LYDDNYYCNLGKQIIADNQRWLAELTSPIIRMLEQIGSGFQQQIAQIKASVDVVAATLFKYLEEQEAAVEAFSEAGWPIAPSMPEWLIRRVVEFHDESKIRYASHVIMGYYRRNNYGNLAKAIRTWKDHPLFASRMHIINDAFWVHCKRKYTLSIPALMAQIEGVLTEFVVANNLGVDWEFREWAKQRLKAQVAIGDPDMRHTFATWAIAKTLLHHLEESTYSPTRIDKQMARPPKCREITRHTVLHGVMPNYNRESHSLKAFLILDAISVLPSVEE